ncbi:MAG TPA: serine protease [Candidatus Angelobacter sp.]|jgi:S1-C subfamily serine protease
MLTKKVFFVVAILGSFLQAAAQDDVSRFEKKLVETAQHVTPAVVPLFYSKINDQSSEFGVVGSGFFVNADGYFITAAHVLERYKPNSGELTVTFRQRDGNGSGLWFDVVEKDEQHDLALCKLKVTPKEFLYVTHKTLAERAGLFASLAVSTQAPETGRFVVIAGFPLQSWSPSIQLGTVAAIETINPSAGRVPAGQRELLQISVAGNKGNSGSPVVELRSGKVIGVIVQAVSAPLFAANDAQLPVAQSSGVMLAVPATWIQALLKRHNITSAATLPTTTLSRKQSH